jgi:hypothetical protein
VYNNLVFFLLDTVAMKMVQMRNRECGRSDQAQLVFFSPFFFWFWFWFFFMGEEFSPFIQRRECTNCVWR